MKQARSVAALAATLVVAGCMGGDTPPFTVGELPRIVLQPADLSGPWSQFAEGRQLRADAPPGNRGDPARFGRLEGWIARYNRQGTANTRGPLVVESRADVFESESGAKEDFDALVEDLEGGRLLPGSGTRLDASDLGEQAAAATVRQGPGATALRYYIVAWRQDNLTAWVFLNGFDRGTTLQDALALARKQQRRIAAAS